MRVLPFIGVLSSCLIDPILCTLQMEEIPDFSLDEDDEARRKIPTSSHICGLLATLAWSLNYLRQMQMVKMVKTVRMKADWKASQSHENCWHCQRRRKESKVMQASSSVLGLSKMTPWQVGLWLTKLGMKLPTSQFFPFSKRDGESSGCSRLRWSGRFKTCFKTWGFQVVSGQQTSLDSMFKAHVDPYELADSDDGELFAAWITKLWETRISSWWKGDWQHGVSAMYGALT